MVVALLECPERGKSGPTCGRLEQIREGNEKTSKAQVPLERDDTMCKPTGQEQRLFRSDSQPARALQLTECGKIEGGAGVHNIPFYVF